MAQFTQGVTYLPVPLDLYMDHQQESMAHALQGGTALIFEGKMTPIEPITTFKMSEVEKAFRFMQSGKHIGKIVLNLDDDDQVQLGLLMQCPIVIIVLKLLLGYYWAQTRLTVATASYLHDRWWFEWNQIRIRATYGGKLWCNSSHTSFQIRYERRKGSRPRPFDRRERSKYQGH